MPLRPGTSTPAMRAAAKARGATGFLKPGDQHTVSVSGMGVVYSGRNRREADRTAHRWTKLSKQSIGRAAGKAVTHIFSKPTQNL